MLSAPSEPALVDPLITPQGKIPKGKSITGKRKPVAKSGQTPQLIPKHLQSYEILSSPIYTSSHSYPEDQVSEQTDADYCTGTSFTSPATAS
jgi:hypothetical protein